MKLTIFTLGAVPNEIEYNTAYCVIDLQRLAVEYAKTETDAYVIQTAKGVVLDHGCVSNLAQ